MLEIFQYPFMQRTFIAGILLGLILAYLGIFVILKKMAFFSDGIAHASLAGVAIAILASFNPLISALIFSIILSIAVFYLEKKTRLSTDAIIGILFSAGMALGVILMSFKSGYQSELISYLFGNILSIKNFELIIIALISVFILIYLNFFQKNLLLLFLDKDLAHSSAVKTDLHQLIFNIILAISVVLGIKILGIVLVSAILILPAATAKLVSNSYKIFLIFTLLISEIIIILGIFISYFLNLPTGATIVLSGASIFFLFLIWSKIFKKT